MFDWLRRMTGNKKSPPVNRLVTIIPSVPEKSTSPAPPTCEVRVPEPRIIPRAEHTLSRRLIATNALKVMGRLIRSGHKAYLCGGSIRDTLIGRQPKDFDVVTDAKPNEIRKIFRNSRLIGRRFRLAHVFFRGGEIIEVSTFRKGVPFDPEGDATRQDENAFGTPGEDACRRDLTVNGLFYDLETFNIIDYVGGMDDIDNKVIRVIGDPQLRFREDPVRMLRAVRHAAGTRFKIEPVTWQAICDNADEIAKTNPSRLRDEFLRELTESRSARSIELMLDLGLLQHIIPESKLLSAHNGEPSQARRYLLDNLRGVDEAIQRRTGELTQPVIFAAFMAPFVKMKNLPAKVADPHRLRGYLPGAIRDYLKPVLQEIGISRGHAEAASMVLVGLYNLEMALAHGGPLPQSLLRKAYLPPALLLFQIESWGRRERLPQAVFNAARDKNLLLFAGPKPAGQRQRRRQPHPKENPNRDANSPTKKTPPKKTPAQPDPTLLFDATALADSKKTDPK